MKRLLAPLIAILLASCAVTHVAPRFSKPSTTALESAHKNATASIKSAREKATAIEQAAPPALKLQVASLKVDLDTALTELSTAEGAREQLDSQLAQEADKANKLADDYDKAATNIEALKISRHRYVKLLLLVSLAEILSLGWIFRKPIMLALASL